MTDTAPASKPMWKRHKGACNQRVFNDPIDWEGHVRNCPYDIRQKLDRLLESLKKLNLDERLEALERADPAADPFAVDDSDDEDEQRSQYADDELDDGFRDGTEHDVDEEPRRLSATDFYGGVS